MYGGIYVLKSKYLSYISLITIIALLSVLSPSRLRAQDDVPSDEEIALPTNSGSVTPPPIIDESDSGAVNDVEEYDG